MAGFPVFSYTQPYLPCELTLVQGKRSKGHIWKCLRSLPEPSNAQKVCLVTDTDTVVPDL